MDINRLEGASRLIRQMKTPAAALGQIPWELSLQHAEQPHGSLMMRLAAATFVNLVITNYSSLFETRKSNLPDSAEQLLGMFEGLPGTGRQVHDLLEDEPTVPETIARAIAYLTLCRSRISQIVAQIERCPALPAPFDTLGEDLNLLAEFIADTKFLFEE